MNRFLLILITILTIACSTQNDLLDDQLVKNGFSNSDVENIHKLVAYFETRIGVQQTNITTSYRNLFQETSFNFDSISNHIFIKDSLRSFLNGIPKTTRVEIWATNNSTAYKSYENKTFKEPIKYKSFDINLSGKYLDLLKDISKEDKNVQIYVGQIVTSGGIPTFGVFNDIVIDKKGNDIVSFKSDYWRMIIAIYYITMLEDHYRYLELSEN